MAIEKIYHKKFYYLDQSSKSMGFMEEFIEMEKSDKIKSEVF